MSLALIFCVNTVSAANEVYVNTTGNDSGTGTAYDPYLTIQTGINNLNPNGIIHLANGQYTGVNNNNITINKNMTITGESQTGTIINGTDTNWIFNVTSGVNFNIVNLTLTNGKMSDAIYGGGAVLNSGNLTTTNCTFTSNTATVGGAIFNDGRVLDDSGSLICTINGCNFTCNTASAAGGAIHTFSRVYGGSCSVTLTLTDCTFTNNTANRGNALSIEFDVGIDGSTTGIVNLNSTITGCNFTNHTDSFGDGGAIYNDCYVSHGSGTFNSTITKCNFTGNTVTYANGGAIHNTCGAYDNSAIATFTSTVDNCNFTNNTAGTSDYYGGGAIYNNCWGGGSPSQSSLNSTITNCNFTGNTAAFGGAIYNSRMTNGFGSNLTNTITGCTFSSNSADTRGGAIYNEAGHCEVHFNRIVGNKAPTGTAIYSDNYVITTGSMNVTNNWWGTNNPVFSSLIAGPVPADNSTWLYMTINATPNTINNTQTSLVTVSFNNRYNGTTVTPYIPDIGEYIPDGSPLSFATTLGSIPGTIINTASGIATATFTASQTAGTAYISGLIDNYQTPYDPNNPNTTPYTTVTINPAAYLNITKTVNMTNVNVGDIIRYNITITNNGPDNVTTITLKDIIPNGTELLTATPPADIYYNLPSGDVELTWTNILDSFGGILPPGMTVSILVDVEILPSAAGTTLYNTANITSNVYPYFNESTANVYVKQDATVELNKTVNNTRPNIGETVLYTIVARNTGPGTANNLVVTDTLPIGLDFVDCTDGGIWDPVTRTVTWPAEVVTNGANVTYYITARVNSTSLAGTNVTNVVNETHTEYPNNSTTNCTIYIPKADLYIQITSDKNNPTAGEIFILTYKLGNKGPDDALNVSVIIPIPERFHILQIYGDGNWTENANGTITWTFNNVTVGDPYLHLYGYSSGEGDLLFTASIFSDTYNPNTIGVNSLTIHTIPQTTEANAATTTTTVGMQSTGTPLEPLALAVLTVLGGLIATRKK